MSTTIQVTVHASLYPESMRKELLEGLRSRRIAPKFHYQTYKQAQLWLALHRARSPAWLDPDAAAVYDRSFAAATALIPQTKVHLTGLGCGGGYKEARLLRLLAEQGKVLSYVPCDVSLPLVLASVLEARNVCATLPCIPLLCDLALVHDLPATLDTHEESDVQRIITFFGMIPNFEPDYIMPKLAALLREADLLLLSANLAPGSDYRAGVQRVLPGYDNPETRAWLLAFLYDLGVEPGDGVVDFSIEEASGLHRIVADFQFVRERSLTVYDEQFVFGPGETVRLFFSYRHTPSGIRQRLQEHGFRVLEQWISASEEEGVFLCQKQAD
jgi:L-histidine N-alpha-methyltransferase